MISEMLSETKNDCHPKQQVVQCGSKRAAGHMLVTQTSEQYRNDFSYNWQCLKLCNQKYRVALILYW